MRSYCGLVCFAVLAIASVRTSAQATPNKEAMLKMLESAAAQTNLETKGSAPFHLQADFETFDVAGTSDGTGTVEEFWDGAGRSKRTVVYRGMSQTRIEDGGEYTTVGPFHSSWSERTLIRGLFEPVPLAGPRSPDLKYLPASLGTVQVGCLNVVVPLAPPDRMVTDLNIFIEDAVHPTPARYCLANDNQQLRIEGVKPNAQLVFNRLDSYGSKIVARELTFAQGNAVRGKLVVRMIEAWTPTDGSFVPPPGAAFVSDPGVGFSNVTQGRIVEHVQPMPSHFAGKKNTSGTVMVAGIISTGGKLDDLEVLSSPDDALTKAVIEAINKWRYKPFSVKGKPIAMDVVISFRFVYV